MAKTQIADVIVPEVFNTYVIEKTAELSALSQAGIISNNPELDALAAAGGKLINMPFWSDLSGADEVLSDSGALTPAKIVAGQDVAVLYMRGKAWGANDLAKSLSGSDPMRAVADLVAGYWARRRQDLLISSLQGAFAAASMAGNLNDISAVGDGKITADAVVDTFQLLGDNKSKLTAIAMHSAVEAYLAKNDLIAYFKDSDGQVAYGTYLGKRVIVDDGLVAASGVYPTYLFGEGAIGLGNGAAPVPVETDRDSLASDDLLISRQHFLLHPRGIKWTQTSVVGSSPTNAEAATSSNWLRVYEAKNIRIALLKHKI